MFELAHVGRKLVSQHLQNTNGQSLSWNIQNKITGKHILWERKKYARECGQKRPERVTEPFVPIFLVRPFEGKTFGKRISLVLTPLCYPLLYSPQLGAGVSREGKKKTLSFSTVGLPWPRNSVGTSAHVKLQAYFYPPILSPWITEFCPLLRRERPAVGNTFCRKPISLFLP